MAASEAQQFLNDLDKKFWAAADKLRSNLDAAVYKHAVLGLIFLKYVSDAFAARRAEVERLLRDPDSDYYLPRDDYDADEEYEAAIYAELEDRDYYAEANVFWVPPLARWQTLQDSAKLPPGNQIQVRNGKTETYRIRSVGLLIDDALDAVETENEKRLKNVLNKAYHQLQLDPDNLRGLIDLIASIPFEHEELHAQDILGHVYEYFLGQFALAEGKKGGQYFTPKSIVSFIVDKLEPHHGRVYDPAMGSGGFFVQSEKFIEAHGGKLGDISVYRRIGVLPQREGFGANFKRVYRLWRREGLKVSRKPRKKRRLGSSANSCARRRAERSQSRLVLGFHFRSDGERRLIELAERGR